MALIEPSCDNELKCSAFYALVRAIVTAFVYGIQLFFPMHATFAIAVHCFGSVSPEHIQKSLLLHLICLENMTFSTSNREFQYRKDVIEITMYQQIAPKNTNKSSESMGNLLAVVVWSLNSLFQKFVFFSGVFLSSTIFCSVVIIHHFLFGSLKYVWPGIARTNYE